MPSSIFFPGAKVPKLFGPVSGASIPVISSQRQGSKPSNFAILLVFLTFSYFFLLSYFLTFSYFFLLFSYFLLLVFLTFSYFFRTRKVLGTFEKQAPDPKFVMKSVHISFSGCKITVTLMLTDSLTNPFFFSHRNALQRTNERLLKLLSDMVKQAASTEETINKQLEDLIQETSQAEDQLTQGPVHELESGTLYESQIPPDSIRRLVRFPGGLLTSTPAAGPGASAANFGTPSGGSYSLNVIQ